MSGQCGVSGGVVLEHVNGVLVMVFSNVTLANWQCLLERVKFVT